MMKQKQLLQKDVQVKGGHLQFKTADAFKNYMTNLGNTPHKERMTRGKLKSTNSEVSFYSFAQRCWDIENSNLKSTENDLISGNDSLVPDPLFQCVLDTNLQVEVGEVFYKIAEYGTFVIHKDYTYPIDLIIKNFSDYKSKLTKIKDGYYKLNDSVNIYDTFGYFTKEEDNEDTSTSVTNTKSRTLKSTASYYDNIYNLETHNYEATGWFAKLWSSIFGRTKSANNHFDSNHRVRCKLSNYNYFFFKSSGFSVGLQEKRTVFLWFKGWRKIKAEKLVLGIEEMRIDINIPPKMASKPTISNNVKYFNDFMVDEQYKGVHKPEIIMYDLNKLPMFHFETFSSNYNLSQIKTNIDNDILTTLKEYTSQSFYYSRDNLTEGTPIMASTTILNGEKNMMRTYCTGLSSYSNTSGQYINFLRSYGMVISSSSSLPRPYNIKISSKLRQAKIFGAAYYNNNWKGVRIIKKE